MSVAFMYADHKLSHLEFYYRNNYLGVFADIQQSTARGKSSNLGWNRGGVGKFDICQPISHNISETVNDLDL